MSDSNRFSAVVAAPFGAVGIVCDAQAVQELIYLPPSFAPHAPQDGLAQRAAQQVAAYLENAQAGFDLPLAPRGTAFQQRVWQAICAIPAGHTQTYGQLARALQSAPRAVGQACGSNWFPLVVPCHRVTAAQGLGGFAHATDDFHLGVKRWLLQHEGVLLL